MVDGEEVGVVVHPDGESAEAGGPEQCPAVALGQLVRDPFLPGYDLQFPSVAATGRLIG